MGKLLKKILLLWRNFIIKTINIKLDYHIVILNKSDNSYYIPLIKPMSNNTYLDIIQKNNKIFEN